VGDARVVFRQLSRSPAHVLAVLLSLSTGIAVCCATFSAALTLIFADLPGISERARLLHVDWVNDSNLTFQQFTALAAASNTPFTAMAASSERTVIARLPSGAATLTAAFVTSDYFMALGSAAQAGRLLSTADAQHDRPVVVITDSLWRRMLGADPSIIGRPIGVAGRTLTIVGITQPEFRGLPEGEGDVSGPEVFVPLTTAPRDDAPVAVIARLKPAETVSSARAFMGVLSALLSSQTPSREPRVLRAYPFGLDWRRNPLDSSLSLALYLLVPLAILGIGCANVVSLQLSRATERARELSVRFSLGASRGQILRLLGLEIAVLASLAGVLGLAGARGLLWMASGLVRWPLAIDIRIAAFLTSLVLAVVGSCGFAPSWLVARDVTARGLRAGISTVSYRRLRGLLVIFQVACSVVLVYLTALGVHALQANGKLIPGFASQIVVADVALDAASSSAARRQVMLDEIVDRAQGTGGQESIAVATSLQYGTQERYELSDQPSAITRVAYVNAVSVPWFALMRPRVLAGRVFGQNNGQRDIVISETLAKSMGKESAIGRRVRLTGAADREHIIIGVIEDGIAGPVPVIYTRMFDAAPASVILLAQAPDGTDSMAHRVRDAIRQVSSEIPIDRIDSLNSRLERASNGLSYMTSIGSALSLVGVTLSALGLFAVMSYAVQKRAREIGIRVAIGATRLHVISLVAGEAWWIVVAGIMFGLVCALPMGYTMRTALFGVSFIGPSVVLPAATGLVLVALVAAAGPCMRALTVEPIAILREE
jgi:predicted permease